MFDPACSGKENELVLTEHSVLNPKAQTDKLDALSEKISQLNECFERKDEYIATLEARLSSMEADLNQLEQYSGGSNVRFSWILSRTTGKIPSPCCCLLSMNERNNTYCECRHSDQPSSLMATGRCTATTSDNTFATTHVCSVLNPT